MDEIKDIEIKNDKKGFTLIELLAAIILLAIVMSISAVSVIGVINKSKSKSYDSLIEYAKIGAKSYFEECDNKEIIGVTGTNKIECNKLDDNKLTVTFGDLLTYGFLVSSSKKNDSKIVENPYNNENMNSCKIIVTKTVINGNVSYNYDFEDRYECNKEKKSGVFNTPSNSSTVTPNVSPSNLPGVSPTESVIGSPSPSSSTSSPSSTTTPKVSPSISSSPSPTTTPKKSPSPTRTIRPIISPSPSSGAIRPVQSPKLETE